MIDEADEMLHSDWEEELRKIMAGGGEFYVFSAFYTAVADTRYQTQTKMRITCT